MPVGILEDGNWPDVFTRIPEVWDRTKFVNWEERKNDEDLKAWWNGKPIPDKIFTFFL